MKFNIKTADLVDLIRQVEDDLNTDIDEGNFVPGSQVLWLDEVPESDKEYFENVISRLSTVGVRLDLPHSKALDDFTSAYAVGDGSVSATAERSSWTAKFNRDWVDNKAVGEAAYLRSDYKKQESNS